MTPAPEIVVAANSDLELLHALFGHSLSQIGRTYKAHSAASAQQAAAALSPDTPLLVVSYHLPPGNSGFAAARKAQERFPDLSIILTDSDFSYHAHSAELQQHLSGPLIVRPADVSLYRSAFPNRVTVIPSTHIPQHEALLRTSRFAAVEPLHDFSAFSTLLQYMLEGARR